MASYEQRKQLEQLMGPDLMINLPQDYASKSNDPNQHSGTESVDPIILDSPKICKNFLVGKCPYDLFQGTKEDFGKCPKLHLEKHKILYETCKRKGIWMPRSNYEVDYYHNLESFINECNRKIRIAEKRLEFTYEEKQMLSNVSRDLDEIDTKIGLMTQEVQVLVEQHELEKAVDHERQLEAKIIERVHLAKVYSDLFENINQTAQQKLQVCEVCGAYLSRLDNDRRLVDHFVGKIHLAYLDLRSILKDLSEKLEFSSSGSKRGYNNGYH